MVDSPWDQLGTLVDELVERVLSVGTTLSPDDWLAGPRSALDTLHTVLTHSSLVVHSRAVLGDTLSVRLHVSLLEVVGELLHVLVVRKQSLGLGT